MDRLSHLPVELLELLLIKLPFNDILTVCRHHPAFLRFGGDNHHVWMDLYRRDLTTHPPRRYSCMVHYVSDQRSVIAYRSNIHHASAESYLKRWCEAVKHAAAWGFDLALHSLLDDHPPPGPDLIGGGLESSMGLDVALSTAVAHNYDETAKILISRVYRPTGRIVRAWAAAEVLIANSEPIERLHSLLSLLTVDECMHIIHHPLAASWADAVRVYLYERGN